MALRVLTDTERAALQGSSIFADRLKLAIRNAGDYWSNHDQTGMTDTLANKITWAKNRLLGVEIVLNDAYVNNPDIPIKAIKVSKGMQFDLGAAPETLENLEAAVTDAKYEEIASLLLPIFGENINMTIGNN